MQDVRGVLGASPLRRQHFVTETHLLVVHNLVSRASLWEAYPLPNCDPLPPSPKPDKSAPSLQRSHTGTIPITITEPTWIGTRPLLATESSRATHADFVLSVIGLHTDSRSVTDFIVAELTFQSSTPSAQENVVLARHHSTQLHYPSYNIAASAAGGCARACCIGWAGGTILLAVTVKEWPLDASAPNVVVRGLTLSDCDDSLKRLQGFSGSLAYDGFTGRLCVLFDRHTSEVEVFDYC